MHNAAAKLDPSIYPKINSMVMFGDPGTHYSRPCRISP